MGICRKERKQTGEELSAREDGGPAEGGAPRRPLWAFHLQTLVCLDSVEVALPRCRPDQQSP